MTALKASILRNIKVVSFCVLLSVLSLAVVHGIMALNETRVPLVDFSEHSQRTESVLDSDEDDKRLRFAVATMTCVETTFTTYKRLIDRICRDLGRQEAFVLRPSYTDVRLSLEQGQVDVAFVCTGTYVHALSGRQIKLLVQPEFVEPLEYRSLLIVPESSSAESLADLRGKTIAFTDPESNTGCLVPSAMLAKEGIDPKAFFEKIIYTGSHDRSIMATALGTVDAAAVDSLVLASMTRKNISYAGKVKVIWESESFGPPPIVVPTGLDEQIKKDLRKAFLTLDQDEEGRKILAEIGIKRFVPARPEDYRSVINLYNSLQLNRGVK